MCSSGLYIHGSWKWQLVQLSINLEDTAQELNENHMNTNLRREQEEVSKRQRREQGDQETERGAGEANLQLEQINQTAEK